MRAQLRALFDAAVKQAMPETCLAPMLSNDLPKGRLLVLGAGKAAASMAEVVSKHYGGAVEGLVVTRYGHGVGHDIPGIEVIEAAHPVPDEMSQRAAQRMLDMASGLGPEDRLIFLASGGGSAVLSLPCEGLTFEEKRALVKHLVLSGAPIHAINSVRKHISAIKGGQLAQAAGDAEVITYVISDVPGDDPADVASGPTIADQNTLAEARAVIEQFGAPDIALAQSVLSDESRETPKALSPKNETHVVAKASDALLAVKNEAEAQGYEVHYLGDDLEGNARDLGAAHGALAIKLRNEGKRAILLSGGEATVVVQNPQGRGGPNMEYVLGAAIAIEGQAGISILACDSDGIDGSEDAAGGFGDGDTVARAQALDLDVAGLLNQNKSFDVLKALGDVIVTGPTRTNVNDIRIIAVEGNDHDQSK
ncbi:MAG: glycerate kinase [Sphingomonadales bacterium]